MMVVRQLELKIGREDDWGPAISLSPQELVQLKRVQLCVRLRLLPPPPPPLSLPHSHCQSLEDRLPVGFDDDASFSP